ncbi:NADH-quinone oxidoreductase subunit NuoG [Gammaproteobacteria bacterium]|nr:NADH-quinone oxidoreductase subunit NuoG [Gammaproteobacteria bacterium]
MTEKKDKIKVTVDGIEHDATPGQMLIELTDQTGNYVPRFCYHEKLSIAANCRMCLVEVENSRNALPACATPVSDGMVVHTKSKSAKTAQESTMEFLLINHPLDCPICDQGGECELQDLAYTYGKNNSRFDIPKQTKKNDDLGPLVSTDMTRCIMCTRCVRFGTEIAGIQELGTIGRGEDSNISTYVSSTVDHELSGNIIDLCPVGALNNKPYRYTDRTWELDQIESISPHDCVGSNIMIHKKNDIIRRIVPKNNPEINETWIADRDRFGFDGIYSEDRVKSAKLRVERNLKDVKLSEVIDRSVELIQSCSTKDQSIGVLISPNLSTEEQYLLLNLCDQLDIKGIDYRPRQRDFSIDSANDFIPHMNIKLSDVDAMRNILILGSDLRRETPILAHRLKKSADNGASVHVINSYESEYHFQVDQQIITDEWVNDMGLVLKAAINLTKNSLPNNIADHLDTIGEPSSAHEAIAASMCQDKSLIIIGIEAYSDSQYQMIRSYAHMLSTICQTNLCEISEGSNMIGASIYGVVNKQEDSLNFSEIVHMKHDLLIMYGIEPEDTIYQAELIECMESAKDLIVFTPYANEHFDRNADVIVPINTHYENNGSMINIELRNQSFINTLSLDVDQFTNIELLMSLHQGMGIQSLSVDEINDSVQKGIDIIASTEGRISNIPENIQSIKASKKEVRFNMYNVDNVLRRSKPLQKTKEVLGEI